MASVTLTLAMLTLHCSHCCSKWLCRKEFDTVASTGFDSKWWYLKERINCKLDTVNGSASKNGSGLGAKGYPSPVKLGVPGALWALPVVFENELGAFLASQNLRLIRYFDSYYYESMTLWISWSAENSEYLNNVYWFHVMWSRTDVNSVGSTASLDSLGLDSSRRSKLKHWALLLTLTTDFSE